MSLTRRNSSVAHRAPYLRIACPVALSLILAPGRAAYAGVAATGFVDPSPDATSSSDLGFLHFNGKDLIVNVSANNQSHLTPGTGNGVDPVPATLTPGASIQVNVFCADATCTTPLPGEITNVQCMSLQAAGVLTCAVTAPGVITIRIGANGLALPAPTLLNPGGPPATCQSAPSPVALVKVTGTPVVTACLQPTAINPNGQFVAPANSINDINPTVLSVQALEACISGTSIVIPPPTGCTTNAISGSTTFTFACACGDGLVTVGENETCDTDPPGTVPDTLGAPNTECPTCPAGIPTKVRKGPTCTGGTSDGKACDPNSLNGVNGDCPGNGTCDTAAAAQCTICGDGILQTNGLIDPSSPRTEQCDGTDFGGKDHFG